MKLAYKYLFYLFIGCSFFYCTTDSTEHKDKTEESLYFPPINSNNWETISIASLNWNTNAEQDLYNFLNTKHSKAFIILKNGKIAVEWYGNGFDANMNHTWNSAAKTLSAFTIGIAQQENLLDIDNPSQDYLGSNWSSMTHLQEEAITVKNHLTMTTGLDYNVPNADCTEPEDLVYKQDPSTFWYYHNAPYTLSHSIIEGATNTTFSNYFNTKVSDKIGMQGVWVSFGCYKLYLSNAKSMARFGLLNLNKGTWENEVILSDTNYFNEMTNTSQNLNKSYGYLWWLNGKSSYRLPGSEVEYQGTLIPNAPSDLIAGLGKNDQKLYIVPSKGLVIVRLGDNANNSVFGSSSFDNQLWEKINALIN
ncbi:serine hydrolase domain-containing protein [Pontimicrobium aquaticum]|uniref:Serine hydrolase n=1 Tax=Pontimicrobium aquaticum TaxID=2565367 RepID=A0A4U0EWK6_9FLAO|nr:serine hydrolase [Pontimicrobium aquaticum]TJY36326.1 serine hydrolase [Pontimicrobium aquaticum]